MEPYLLASSLVGLVAQRLMRKVCPHCGQAVEPSAEERRFSWGRGRARSWYPRLSACNNTAYSGRIAIHEVAVVDRGMRDLISRGASLSVN